MQFHGVPRSLNVDPARSPVGNQVKKISLEKQYKFNPSSSK